MQSQKLTGTATLIEDEKKRTLILQYTFVFVFSDKEQDEINGKIMTLKVFSPLTKETIESKDE